MPLREGNSPKIVSQNIREFHTGKTYAHTLSKFGKAKANKQAIAVALSTARKYGRKYRGGKVRKYQEGGSDDTDDKKIDPVVMPGDWESLPRTAEGRPRISIPAPSAPPPKSPDQKWVQPEETFMQQRQREGNIQPYDPLKNPLVTAGQNMIGGTGMDLMEPFAQGPNFQNVLSSAMAATAAAPMVAPEKEALDIAPQVLKGWKKLGESLGEGPGGMFTSPEGQMYYVKTQAVDHPAPKDYRDNEVLANKLYQLAGVPVPDIKTTTYAGRPAIASPIVKGDSLLTFDPSEYANIKGLKEHFAADAWLANWDVIGAGYDAPKGNILVDSNNNAWRIDQGGALRYRGLGEQKGNKFGPKVGEIESLKDEQLNPSAAQAFEGHEVQQYDPTATRIANITDKQIAELVAKYGPPSFKDKAKLTQTLVDRRNHIAEIYGVNDDPWNKGGGGGGGNIFEQTPYDFKAEEAKTSAEYLAKYYPDNPYEIAKYLHNFADLKSPQEADAIFHALPEDMKPDVNAMLSQHIEETGYDPWSIIPLSPKEKANVMLKKYEDSDNLPVSIANELWNIASKGNGGYADEIFKQLPDDLYPAVHDEINDLNKKFGDPWSDEFHKKDMTKDDWDDLDAEYEKAMAAHEAHESDLYSGRYAIQDEGIASHLKPIDWTKYKVPETETHKTYPLSQFHPESTKLIPENLVNHIKSLFFNPEIPLWKGGFKGYPEKINDPTIKHMEQGFFLHDHPRLAEGYAGEYFGETMKPGVTPYVVRSQKAAEVDWRALTGAHDYFASAMDKLINAGHANGNDLIVLRNISDVGSYAPETQYIVLDPAILRAPHASFSPSELHMNGPLRFFPWGAVGVVAGRGLMKDEGHKRGGTVQKKAFGGPSNFMEDMLLHNSARNLHYEGMIKSGVPGRTDKIHMNVPAGSYVLPADIPSALGQGNSVAGGRILQKMFSSGPLGMSPMRGMGRPNFGHMGVPGPRPLSMGNKKFPYATGGATDTVPIVAAGGEFTIHPDVVKDIGHGDIKAGHRVLDKFVLKVRKEHIKTLRKLKPPKK